MYQMEFCIILLVLGLAGLIIPAWTDQKKINDLMNGKKKGSKKK